MDECELLVLAVLEFKKKKNCNKVLRTVIHVIHIQRIILAVLHTEAQISCCVFATHSYYTPHAQNVLAQSTTKAGPGKLKVNFRKKLLFLKLLFKLKSPEVTIWRDQNVGFDFYMEVRVRTEDAIILSILRDSCWLIFIECWPMCCALNISNLFANLNAHNKP